MRIVADVTGYPVWTIREDVEAALGAARLAALGVGLIAQSDGDSWITLVERAAPNPERKRHYDGIFEIYRGLYPALRDSMHGLARLRAPS
jgi:xylulokinase